jgi:N,N-dimethylformamidase beta subunit-like protein
LHRSWTHIVPGVFGDSGYTGLLLYDQAAGFGAFYETDGHGNLNLLREYDDYPFDATSWTQILSGRFTDTPYTGLLLYDQAIGFGAFYDADGHGNLNPLSEYPELGSSWTHIVAGEFINNGAWGVVIDDLFFYDGSTGLGETYESDGQGGIKLTTRDEDLPPAVAQIVPGSFGGGGDGNTNLLFYDGASGIATIRNFEPSPPPRLSKGHGHSVKRYPRGWATSLEAYSWPRSSRRVHPDHRHGDLLIPGNFWMADSEDRLFPDGAFTDLVLYNRADGYGEIYSHEPPDPTPIAPFDGYVSSGSVLPGDTIDFHISSQVGPYAINLYRQEANEVPVGHVDGLPTAPTPFPIGRTAYKTGAGWPAAGSLTVPESWPSGLYIARVESPSILVQPTGDAPTGEIGRRRAASAARIPIGLSTDVPPLDIPFVVRASGGPQARILFAIADNTYSAYNFWGGRSVYGYGHAGVPTWVFPSSSAFRAPYGFRVSFLRGHAPMDPVVYAHKWKTWEVPFLQWVHRQGIKVDLCTESDLHKMPGILDGYRLLLIVGHSEYWSGEMRDQVEDFAKNGGNVAFFAGNVCWWQVRFEDGGDTMVCYKQKEFDPASQSSSTLPSTTVNWSEPYLQRPEMQLTGVRWSNHVVSPEDRLQYVVANADHWVFANTGLTNGDAFGLYGDLTVSAISGETDCKQTDSPPNFRCLAFAQDASGNEIATMGLFSPTNTEAEYSGVVFTAAANNWSWGLSQDGRNPMDLITRNVLVRLG